MLPAGSTEFDPEGRERVRTADRARTCTQHRMRLASGFEAGCSGLPWPLRVSTSYASSPGRPEEEQKSCSAKTITQVRGRMREFGKRTGMFDCLYVGRLCTAYRAGVVEIWVYCAFARLLAQIRAVAATHVRGHGACSRFFGGC